MPDTRIRILHIEDELSWIKQVQKALDPLIYDITPVMTLVEAEEKLASHFYHILIIDIQLNKTDLSDATGMEYLRQLATSPIGQSTEIIMLSIHAEWMRESFKDYGVADFIDKKYYTRENFAKAVEKIVFPKFRLNRDLTILWQDMPDKAREAVNGLKVGSTRLKNNDPKIDQLADELDDLLHRLFLEESSVVIERLNKSGFSGAGVLRATPYRSSSGTNRMGRPLVLKYGDRNLIEQESKNFHLYVRPHQIATHSTHIDHMAYSVRLGALAYSFVGTSTEPFYDFDTFYTQASDSSPVIKLLTHLFQENFRDWYRPPRMSPPIDLEEEYWTDINIASKLKEVKEHIQVYERDGFLNFSGIKHEQKLPNPLLHLAKNHRFLSVHQSITHGDLNERNILIDPESKQPWVIDFTTTSDTKHMLRDFAELDMSIRLELLRENDATLEERYIMEKTLCSINYFRDLSGLSLALIHPNPKLQKAFASTIALRQLAFDKLGRDSQMKMYEYFIALFYYTLNSVRYTTFSVVQREHAIISSSLLSVALAQ